MYRGSAYRRVGNTTVEMRADEYRRMLFERLHSERRWRTSPRTIGRSTTWTRTKSGPPWKRPFAVAVLRIRNARSPRPASRPRAVQETGSCGVRQSPCSATRNASGSTCLSALLRVARFDGIDRTEFLDNRQFHGKPFRSSEPPSVSARQPAHCRAHRGGVLRANRRTLFPPLATREALANAICHRDYTIGGGSVGLAIYDDRLEITSRVRFISDSHREKLFLPHEIHALESVDCRLLLQARHYRTLGRGTLKMAELATAAGLPRPEIADAGGAVTVRFRHNASPVRVAGRRQTSGISVAVRKQRF